MIIIAINKTSTNYFSFDVHASSAQPVCAGKIQPALPHLMLNSASNSTAKDSKNEKQFIYNVFPVL